MGPSSGSLQLVTVIAAVLCAIGTASTWDLRPGRWRWPVRVLTLVLCPTLALAAAAVAVNREVQVYHTWGQLLGVSQTTEVVPPDPPAAGAPDPGAGASQVVSMVVDGKRSGIKLPAYVYLPAGYDSPEGRRTRFPVIEAIAGYPGTPQSWFTSIGAGTILDSEIRAGRMAPTVVVFPVQALTPDADPECVDAVGGAQFDTYLGLDVPDAVTAQFRVRADRAGWGLIGYSTGGFCAANLALRHPDRFAAGASLSGYFTAYTDAHTGDLYRGDARVRNENSPLWRVRNLPIPAVALYLAAAHDDRDSMRQIRDLRAAARSPLRVTTGLVARGGHTLEVWSAIGPAAFDWLSGELAAPVAAG